MYHNIKSVNKMLTSCICTVVHYAVLEAIRAVYGIWQIWSSVNRKRLKILRSRLVYTIMMWSRVVVQNLTRQVEEVSVFLQAHNQSNIFFVSCTDHKSRNTWSIWSSKHVVSCTDMPFGVTTFKFNIFHFFKSV